MVENFKHLYEQMKKIVVMYQDSIVPGFRKKIEDMEKNMAEVVRCKDCKRCYEHRTKRNGNLMRFCMRMDGNEFKVNANDFCSYGERKIDD